MEVTWPCFQVWIKFRRHSFDNPFRLAELHPKAMWFWLSQRVKSQKLEPIRSSWSRRPNSWHHACRQVWAVIQTVDFFKEPENNGQFLGQTSAAILESSKLLHFFLFVNQFFLPKLEDSAVRLGKQEHVKQRWHQFHIDVTGGLLQAPNGQERKVNRSVWKLLFLSRMRHVLCSFHACVRIQRIRCL